jgi:hypothetical protein
MYKALRSIPTTIRKEKVDILGKNRAAKLNLPKEVSRKEGNCEKNARMRVFQAQYLA